LSDLFLLFFGICTLLLRAGFALQASGSLRAKNSAAAILRITADSAAAALTFWAIGAGFLFQAKNNYIGFDSKFLCNTPADLAGSEFFHLTVCLIGGAVITGALAERVKFYVGVAASAVLGGIVFPILGHLVWFGKLHMLGCVDFGGAAVIHLPAAVFGAVGVAIVGSRAGKYNKDGSSNVIPGHSLPMLGLGSMFILIGWFPYLLGCLDTHWAGDQGQNIDINFGMSAINILLAGMAGIAGGLAYSHFRYRKPDMFFAYWGLLGALVAISPGFAGVQNWGAVLIGFIAGILVPMVTLIIDLDAHLDDPIGLVAIHGVGSIWGLLATALFITPLHFTDNLRVLAVQAGTIALVVIVSAILAVALFLGLKAIGSLRVVEADEFDGLDIGEHDINSYPDFQQTTIKSYHLREA
jgi:Amt family ammonium transporter